MFLTWQDIGLYYFDLARRPLALRAAMLVLKSHGMHDLVHNAFGLERSRPSNRAPYELWPTLSADWGSAISWMLCKH